MNVEDWDRFVDIHGRAPVVGADGIELEEMHDPARCRWCSGVYDLARVVVQRYLDCSVWRAPCCKALVDDRGDTGWKPVGDYRRLRQT